MTNSAASKTECVFVKRLLAQRREREEVLGPTLAHEPAWPLLMALFVAHEEGEPAAVTRLSEEAGTPPAATVRWLTALASEGKVNWWTASREPDRARVDLTTDMADRLRTLFRTWMEESA